MHLAPRARFALLFLALVASPTLAQSPTDFLSSDQVKQLVSGRTWVIGWQRDLANAATVTHWDFKNDGTVCARFIGGKPKDRCADSGMWQLKGEVLCWDLERIGETYGYKSVCVRIRKVDDKSYEAIADGGKLHPPLFLPIK